MTEEIRPAPLLVRRWSDAARAPSAAHNADPEVMEHFPSTLTREQSDRLADRIEAGHDAHGYGLWAVEAGGRFVGFCGLSHLTWPSPWTPALEVGWRLARSGWGHGWASEAATAALAVGLAHEERVVSITAVGNLRSRRVMERIGMAYAGEVEHPHVPEGSPLRPHVVYVVERSS